MTTEVKLETLAPEVNTTFKVNVPEVGEVDLELVEATDDNERFKAKEGEGAPKMERASFLFRGPKGVYIPQDTYQLQHPKLGEISITITPTQTQKDDGFYCHSSVCRLLGEVKDPSS